MERNKILGVLLLVVLCVCFFSLSAVAVEHPWDQDGTGSDGDGNTDTDSTIVPEDNFMPEVATSSVSEDGSGFGSLLLAFSYHITVWYYNDYFVMSQSEQVQSRRKAFIVQSRGDYRK